MRISVIFVSLLFLSALGAGGVWYRYTQSPLRDDAFRTCQHARGEWVYNAAMPLCVLSDGTLMTFVDGAYVSVETARQSVETTRRAVSTVCENNVIDEIYTGPVSAVDFSSWPGAERYRTAIAKDVVRGVNFAGAYVVSTWGCASGRGGACVGHAVVDVRDGRIVLYGVEAIRPALFTRTYSSLVFAFSDGSMKTWDISLVEAEGSGKVDFCE